MRCLFSCSCWRDGCVSAHRCWQFCFPTLPCPSCWHLQKINGSLSFCFCSLPLESLVARRSLPGLPSANCPKSPTVLFHRPARGPRHDKSNCLLPTSIV